MLPKIGGIVIHRILDENYYDLLVERNLVKGFRNKTPETGINSRHTILHIKSNRFRMCDLGKYPYHIFPSIYTLNSALSLERSTVNTVRNNRNLNLRGQGVLIGFIDTGIDYQHQAFLHPDGTTRIHSLWDQTIESDSPPEGQTLGTEYSRDVINIALKDHSPQFIVPSTDNNGHGTMMAGIAAGSLNEPEGFSGVAPEAELVVVKLAPAKRFNKLIFGLSNCSDCYTETNILLGFEYLRSVANRLNRPMVICFGLGSSQGDHNGTGLLSSYIEELSTIPGISVCVSAGNEGNKRRHYRGQTTITDNVKDFELRIDEQDSHFFLEIWQKSPGRLTIDLTSPGGEGIKNIIPKINDCQEINFILASTKVIINNFIWEEESGEQLILIRFESALSGIWTIRATNIDDISSYFDAWLPAGNLISDNTYFMEPDPYVTITSPGNSRSTLTVTAYNEQNNSILINSSRGYKADGEVEPDIAAPGYMLPCPVTNNSYGSATGTGAACAHTAGIIAMLMEWAVLQGNYTTITGRNINRLLIRGAKRDNNMTYPNPIWGYGLVDVMGVFQSLI